MSMLLLFRMCASSVCFLCIPFILICRILRSCLLCCVDFGCSWFVADVGWGGLVVGEMVADAQVSNADWGVLFMGRLVTVALVGDVVWGVLGFDGLMAGVFGGEVGVGSQATVDVWGGVGENWLVLFLESGGWV